MQKKQFSEENKFWINLNIIQAFQIGATLLKFALEVVIFFRFVENQFTCCKFIAGSE